MNKAATLPVCADMDDAQLLETVMQFYQQRAAEEPHAAKLLDTRCLRHPDLWNTFRVGLADRELGRRLPPSTLKVGRLLRERLTRMGVYRPSGHGHFNGCLVVPICNALGQVVEVYGRKLNSYDKRGHGSHRWLHAEPQGVFNEASLAAGPELILTDSVLNALSFWCADYRQVTCTLWSSTLNSALLEAIEQAQLTRVLLAQRNTVEGDQAAAGAAKLLQTRGIETRRLHLPVKQDANDVLRRSGANALAKLIERPVSQLVAMELTEAVEVAEPTPRGTELPPTEQAGTQEETRPTENQSRQPIQEIAATDPTEHCEPLASREPTGPAENTHEPTSATPAKPSPATNTNTKATNTDVRLSETDVKFHFADRHYRVRGLDNNHSLDRMKINLLVERLELIHVDTLDLYSAPARKRFITQAAEEIYVDHQALKQDLGKILLQLEKLQEQQLKETLFGGQTAQAPPLSDKERSEAIELLEDPQLLDRILSDYDRCGLVGEETNKLICYLGCVSRLLERPLAIMIQSSSAAGKTTLMDAALGLIPEEETIRYSAMTGQSLYYMGQKDLRHKILAVSEEEGVAQASYALKLLQSDGKLRIASAGKNAGTGRQQTEEYEVQGPVMMFLTTTSETPDPELQNRCFTLRVNESPEQTAAIHARQAARYTLAGQQRQQTRQATETLHQNAQRLLESRHVLIPWAEQFTFRRDQTRMRRDYDKYLTLIASLTLLHQHQRETVEQDGASYLLATLQDVQVANRLASHALGQSLDTLMPQTRQLLVLLDDHLQQRSERESRPRTDLRFSQRELREALGWSDFQIRKHLARLVDLEYVLAYRTGRGNERHYQLLYDGQGRGGEPFLLGLLDVAKLTEVKQPSQEESSTQELATETSPNSKYDKQASTPLGGFEHPGEGNEPLSSPNGAAIEPSPSSAQINASRWQQKDFASTTVTQSKNEQATSTR